VCLHVVGTICCRSMPGWWHLCIRVCRVLPTTLHWCWKLTSDITYVFCVMYIYMFCVMYSNSWHFLHTVRRSWTCSEIVWYSGLTAKQASALVMLQKSAMNIIFPNTNTMSVSHYRTFRHFHFIAKRSQNGFSDSTLPAVLPASITSSLIYVIHSSLINLEMLKYFSC